MLKQKTYFVGTLPQSVTVFSQKNYIVKVFFGDERDIPI
jgi:hypothetical protein